MGFDSIIPDKEVNLGGRPKKQDEENDNKAKGDPYTINKDSKEWWQEKYNENDGDIIEITDVVHTNTIHVREKLEEYNIIDVDWDALKEETEDNYIDLRWPGEEVEEKKTSSRRKEPPEDGAFTSLM